MAITLSATARERSLRHGGERRVALFPLIIFLLSFVAAASVPGEAAPGKKQAEKPYALIYGTLWGPDNRPVQGVKIKIRRASEKKARWELISDHSGEFAQRLPVGKVDYVVWADLKGVKALNKRPLQLVEPVTVHMQNDERQDIGLHLK